MTEITYKDTHDLPKELLCDLFLSVDWKSANYPSRLVKAIKGSDTVITAWTNDQLIGLVNAIDDGEMTAYIHYLLVNPEYQGLGIGTELMQRISAKYTDYLYTIVIAESEELVAYYESIGFSRELGHTAMFRMNYANKE